jgi:uncharacterized protein
MRELYLNLPVKDLKKSMAFFSELGFSFNPEFTSEKSGAMRIEDNIVVMLLPESHFKEFIPGKNIADTGTDAEALIALSSASKEAVDTMLEKVIAAGGKEYREKQDYGWMYGRAFQDLNGHIWEIIFMNKDAMPEEMKNKAK